MNLISSPGQDCWNIAKRSVCVYFKGEMKVFFESIVLSHCYSLVTRKLSQHRLVTCLATDHSVIIVNHKLGQIGIFLIH